VASEGAFDIARLSHVRADAGIAELLQETAPWVATAEEDLFIPLPTGGSASWLSGLDKGLRSDIRQRTRRMEKLGFNFSICDSRASVDRALDAVIKQKQEWARSRGVWSFITASAGPAFLRQMAYNLSASGTLHLSVLHSGEQIAAAHLGFLREDRLYYYMPTFDRSLGNHGFGSVLQERLIMWACDNGVRRFDMLLGAEPYKARYQPSADSVRTYVLARTAFGSLALRAARAYMRYRDTKVPPTQS
jgi:CelD/BcsL family acetyltransferase involved in cellulose biosynthesis